MGGTIHIQYVHSQGRKCFLPGPQHRYHFHFVADTRCFVWKRHGCGLRPTVFCTHIGWVVTTRLRFLCPRHYVDKALLVEPVSINHCLSTRSRAGYDIFLPIYRNGNYDQGGFRTADSDQVSRQQVPGQVLLSMSG